MVIAFNRQLMRGFGQIMLQNNALTGLLFLLGIAYGSTAMAMAALLATASATLAAHALKLNRANIDSGLYGFSAALVGVALLLFFKAHWLTWAAVIVGGVLAMLLQELALRLKIAVFTLPFILVTWLALWLGQQYSPELLAHNGSVLLPATEFINYALLGYGQVIFQGSLIAGLVFFVAVFIANPLAALYALSASALSGALAVLLGAQAQDVAFGLLSFNAVLTAIVFAGPKTTDAYWAMAAVLLTLVISLAMLKLNLVQLTFPFVAASMAMLGIKKLF